MKDCRLEAEVKDLQSFTSAASSIQISSTHHYHHHFRTYAAPGAPIAKETRCMKNIKEHNKNSAVAEMGDRLATIHIGRKVGAVVSLSGGSWVTI